LLLGGEKVMFWLLVVLVVFVVRVSRVFVVVDGGGREHLLAGGAASVTGRLWLFNINVLYCGNSSLYVQYKLRSMIAGIGPTSVPNSFSTLYNL
jgi:hypothetical protein